jgi:hypothetical protein
MATGTISGMGHGKRGATRRETVQGLFEVAVALMQLEIDPRSVVVGIDRERGVLAACQGCQRTGIVAVGFRDGKDDVEQTTEPKIVGDKIQFVCMATRG